MSSSLYFYNEYHANFLAIQTLVWPKTVRPCTSTSMMAGLHVHNFSNTYLDDWLGLRAVSETKTLFQLFSVIHTYRMRKFLTSFFAGVCIVTIIIIIPNDVEAYSHGLLISGCNYHKHCMLAYRIIIHCMLNMWM